MTLTVSELRQSPAATLSIKEVGRILGLDSRTVSKGIQDGTIPSIRVGRRVLVPREKFLRLLEADDD